MRCSIAEHGYDYRDDLRGDGWHGAMNYAGFLRPVWLLAPRRPARRAPAQLLGVPGRYGNPRRGRRGRRRCAPSPPAPRGHRSCTRGRSSTATTAHGSRPSPASRERQLVGIGMQMTLPGVPMVFAGDEIGLEGEWGEDARRTMPWDRPESWDSALLEEYRESDRPAPRIGRTLPRRPALRGGRRRGDRLAAGDRGRAAALPGRAVRARADPPVARRARLRRARDPVRRRRVDRRKRGSPAGRRPCVPHLETGGTDGGRHLRARGQDLRQRRPGRLRPVAGDQRRRVPRPRRTVRLRQDDGAAHGGRARGHLRRASSRSAAGWSTTCHAEGARHRDGLPELRAVPAPVGRREHRLRAAPAQGVERGDQRAGRRGPASCST